jgi:CubicO group peptidase (beta-lactamase class C family)
LIGSVSPPYTHTMKNIYFPLIAAICITVAACVGPGITDTVSPDAVNMSASRLGRIDSLLEESINNKWIGGAVGYIAREGKIVYYKAFGINDMESQSPLSKEGIFRIASQTKAIASVGVMILYEEGKFLLDDPVSRYIPEFSNPVVVNTYNADDTTYTTIPANREITVRDLLTHTSGIDYPGIGSSMMNAIYTKSDIPAGFVDGPLDLGDAIKKLAKLPLVHQPGERFTYGLNTDVLGYLIEVVSGMSLDEFLKQRLFEPLGMRDTYFYLPVEKHSRLVSLNTEDAGHRLIKWTDSTIEGINVNYPLVQGTYYSGGAGLSSTIKDYGIFLQMLLNGGDYNGKRILSRRSVELMTSNQIGNLNLGANKFGLGFEITTKEGQVKLGVTEGSFAWGGFFGTTYWVDPEEELVCMLFCQQWPISHGEIGDKFTSLVYASLDD